MTDNFDPNQQAKRLTVSGELRAVLECEKSNDFERIITGDMKGRHIQFA
jgi:hypothetical protein